MRYLFENVCAHAHIDAIDQYDNKLKFLFVKKQCVQVIAAVVTVLNKGTLILNISFY